VEQKCYKVAVNRTSDKPEQINHGGEAMQDLIKKFVDFGLETQSRMADFLTNVLNKAHMDEEERKKVVDEINQKMADSKEKGEKIMRDLLDKLPSPMIFARQKDLDALQQRLEQIEERLKALENK
jgi:polyhydroxyalkanoate synthesis regulator phasin